jgi:thiamine-monophosphate kinase
VGDDAAVVRGPRGEDLVVTQDIQVEGHHFSRDWFSGRELGWRLAAVNLSDVAAMGAEPRYALFSLVLPASLDPRYVEQISKGLVAHLARFGAALIGGNISTTDGPLTCDLTVIGSCRRGRAWYRRAAAGEAIVLVGRVGEAAAGLTLFKQDPETMPRGGTRLVRAFKRPEPLLDVAELLRGGRTVRGAIDVSDGFSTDLLRVCRHNGVGCEVFADRLPLSRALARFCDETGRDAVDTMLSGGEDYALILTVSSRSAERVCRRIEETTGHPARVVGTFTRSERTVVVQPGDRRTHLRATGWDHLATPP